MESDERAAGGAGAAEELKDPMSGYASADALGAQGGGQKDQAGPAHVDQVQDSMSGYASADALGAEKHE